jgi:hypothetical protein
MPRPLSELSNEELIALATAPDSPPTTLDQLSDADLAELAVKQGYWQQPEAAAAVVEKKKRDRAPELERMLPALPTDAELQTMSAEQIEARFTANTLGRAAMTRGGRVGDVAAQVLAPIGGAIVGGVTGGLPGVIAGGAAGGAAGDLLAQQRQILRGERDEIRTGELVTATLAGAVPLPAAQAAKPLAMMGRRAVQGAGIATSADAVGQVIDTGTVDLTRLAATGALGLLFGGAVGGAESAILRKEVLKAVRATPEFRDFKGTEAELIDAVKAKVAPAKTEPVNVTPEAPAAAAPTKAQTDFEARAGMLTPEPAPAPAATPEVTPAAPVAPAASTIPPGNVDTPAAPVAPLADLSDEELLTLARSAGAEITAPATPVTGSPAPAPEGASGLAPVENTAETVTQGVSGSQEPETTADSGLESKNEPSSNRLIAEQRRKLKDLARQAKTLAEIDPARANNVQDQINGERERLARMIANKRTGPRPLAGMSPDGSPDLISDIAEYVGFLSSKPPVGKEVNSGEYDDISGVLQSGAARLLRSRQGTAPDRALVILQDAGYNFQSISEFAEAIAAASSRRQSTERRVVEQLYEAKTAAALFENAGRRPHLNPTEGVNSNTLEVGQSFHIRGELYPVKDINPDTGEVLLTGGVSIKIPPDTLIYPDRGVVFPAAAVDTGLNPFEPPAPSWNSGLGANNRYAELSKKLVEGTIAPLERLELDGFEAGAGQLYVPGSMDPAVVQADKARAAAKALEQTKAQMRAKADQRLLASDLQTQQDMFGDQPGTTGSLFEPENQLDFYPLLPASGTPRPTGAAAAATASTGGLSAPRGSRGIGVDPATYLADPIANAGPLSAALAQHGRVSSIVADFFNGTLPSWSPVGKVIRNAADVGALMAPLRNPYTETFKVVVVDAKGRVQHAEVAHIGVLASTNASLAAVLRIAKKTKATRVILSHNHPSGDPTPSLADWRVHDLMMQRLKDHGIELVDDVVTNGHSAYSLRVRALWQIDHASPAPWEKLGRNSLFNVKNAEVMARLAGELRQSNPDSAFILYLTQKNALTAVEQFPAALSMTGDTVSSDTPAKLLTLIEAGVAREGAAAVILVSKQLDMRTLSTLREGMQPIAHFLDAITDKGSYAGMGLMEQAAALAPRAGQLREDPSPYGDLEPDAPIIVQSAGLGSPYAKVRLAHLAKMKIVQMPELVRLVRELTGSLPMVKKLRSNRGEFHSKDASVRLDPRIFRDQLSAAKTLAHEIGHLTDYLDDGTLRRGNLLGRLHSLRAFLANTFGATSVTNKELRAELIDLGQWWKPFDAATAPAWFRKYRESSKELYADAISILFNSPAELKARAPLFWGEFFGNLDKKPEVKTTLFELWDFLNKPHLQTLERRSDDIRKMFVQGDEIFLKKAEERKARYATFRGWNDRLRQELFDTFDPLVRRGAKLERSGTKIPPAYNPRLVFDEHPLADNANYRMLQRLWESVVKPVEAEGYTLHELGEYLFLKRVLTERFEPGLGSVGRAELANPLGMTPDTARLGLLRMRLQGGFPRFNRLEAAAEKFHDIIFQQIKEAVEVGAYSRKIFDEVLAPNRSTYATFAVLDYLQDYVPAALRMQEGTFKEIANPFTATVLKTITLNRLIQVQKSKRAAVKFLQEFDPGSIAPAPRTFDGTRFHVQQPRDRDRALLELLDDGKAAGFHVDPAIAEMFETMPGPMVSAITTVLNWPFRNLIYPLIIKYNPAFQLVMSPLKDLRRTFVNMPRATSLRYAGEYVRNYLTFLGFPATEAGTAVRAYLRGQPHPLIAEMIARQAIGTPLDNFARDFGRGDQMERLLRDFGLMPKDQQRNALRMIFAPVLKLGEAIEFAGLTFEMLPKVTAYRILTRDLGWHAREAAHFARNSVGVPNIYRKGRHVKVVEAFLPFFKVFLNGTRNDLALATMPKTAGGWWFRWAASDGIWTMMQALAAAGLLGAGLKELYDGVSDYNKSNYNVIPIGTIEGGQFGKRVANIRMPRDELHRWMSGLMYQGIMSAAGEASQPGMSRAIGFGNEQLPGLNPVLKIADAWKDYLEGENPMDDFRGRPVLTNAEWLAGGWPAYKGMIGFTLQNAGVSNFIRWDTRAATTAEMTLSAIPGLNRFVQTTDTGYRERQEQQQEEESRQRAQVRVAMPENVQNLLGEYYYLNSVKADLRTLEQTQRLMTIRAWRTRIYQPYEDVAGAEISFGRRLDRDMLKNLETATEPFERGK